MKRPAKILLWTLGSLVAVFVILSGTWYMMNARKIRQAAEKQRLCDDRLARLQHNLPLGTSREEVIRYLQTHQQDMVAVLSDGDNLQVTLGRIHENSWVCNYFDKYAVLTFTTKTSPQSVREYLDHITPKSVGQCL